MISLSWYYLLVCSILLPLCVGGTRVYAQQPAFNCTRLTTADGLSDNMVFCALQDKHGFMWFGTRDGLNRYDGHKFTVYRHNPKDSTSIAGNSISCLFEDKKGNLWVGSDGGVQMFDNQNGKFIGYYTSPLTSPQHVTSICDDRNGNIWFITTSSTSLSGAKLIKIGIRNRTITSYRHTPNNPFSINSNAFRYLCRDSSGVVWVITSAGLNRYDDNIDVFLHSRNTTGYDIPLPPATYIIPDQSSHLWIGDSTGRTTRIIATKDTLIYQVYATTPVKKQVGNMDICLLVDKMHTVWTATNGNGLYIIDTLSGEYIPVPQDENTFYNLPSKHLFSLYQDRIGNIWVCTYAGIAKFHYQTHNFQHFSDKTGLSHNAIRSVLRHSNGNLFIGTSGSGIDQLHSRFNKNYLPIPPYTKSYPMSTINTMYEDSRRTLWLGTNGGLCVLPSESAHYKPANLGVNNERVWSILEGSNGDLWVGTLYGGLNRVTTRDQHTTYFFYNEKINGQRIVIGALSLLESPKNTLWVGTTNGLYKMNTQTNTWKHYQYTLGDSTGLNNNDIWGIHQTRDGALWLATSGGGLNRFDPKTDAVTHVTEKDGLPSNIICAILEDDYGNLWVSTSKGLARYNPKNKKVKTFGVGDGLYISEFHFKTCFKDADGSMYFGGTGGYVHFHPDSIADNTTPPPMAFTGFRLFDNPVLFDTAMTHKRTVVLAHDKNFFTVEFAALDFSNPAKNMYRYKLEGLDEQWRTTDGTKPYASYTGVPPGEYTLHVQGSNSDGAWNTKGIRLTVVITPAWWQTWWFKFAVLALLAVLVVLGLQWRYRSLKRRNEVEKKLVESQLQALRSQMNPHFIFNSLNSILHFITSNEQETAHVYLSKFSKLIRAILEQSRNEFIPLSEELYVLGLYLELEALRFDNRFSYSITVSEGIDVQEQQIPPMLLQPHVENAIKHGLIHTVSDGRLEVVIRREGEHVVCSVIDNGIGRQRSQLLRGQSVVGHISRGTSLTEDRLSILNNLHSAQYGVEIHDLTGADGLARGTRVDVKIASAAEEQEE